MRILFDARVLNSPSPSGVGHYAKSLLTQMLKSDSEHEFVLFQNSYANTRFDLLSLCPADRVKTKVTQVIRTKYPNKLLSFGWAFSSRPKLEDQLKKIDLVHSPHINSFRKTSIPRLTTVHDISFERFPQFLSQQSRLWHRMMSYSAKRSEYFIADSHSTKQDMIKIWRIPSQRIKVIYPGVDDLTLLPSSEFDPLAARLNLSQKYFLFLSTLEPRKNLTRLINAFKELISSAKYKDFQLVLGGQPGYQSAKIIAQINKLDLNSSVILTGYLSQEDKISLLRHAFAFVYPSLYEGFGLPLLEAMQFGVPILSADISSIPEVTADNALLIDPFDTDQILQGLSKLADDSSLRDELKQKGLQRYRQFSWDKCAGEILEYYEQIA